MLDQFVSKTAKRAAVIIAIMGCSYLALIMMLTLSTLDAFANDFVVYWDTANRPLWLAYEQRRQYPFPYMPTMLLWIEPLSFVPAGPAYVTWIAISALAFTWSARQYLTLTENLLALVSRPVVFCLMTGQVSVFLAGFMLLVFGARRRCWAGVGLGIIASIKPQLVLMAPLFLLLRRDFQMMACAALSLAAIVLAALLAYGTQPWIDWLASLDNFRSVLTANDILRNGASPASQADRAGYPPLPFMLFGMALGSWLIYRCRSLGPLEITAAVATASILAAPYAMVYDLAPVVPFLATTVFRNRLMSSVALMGLFHPLPILVACFELLRTAKHKCIDRHTDSGSIVQRESPVLPS